MTLLQPKGLEQVSLSEDEGLLSEHAIPPLNLWHGLQARLQAMQTTASSTVALSIEGVWCVLKYRRASAIRQLASYGLRYLRAWVLAAACKVFLGEFPDPRVLLKNGLTDEAARLRVLLQAGCRVPAIWWQAPGLLVLEHVGDDLSSLIRQGSDARRVELVRQAGQDLAHFHGQGFCHGGAQLRNLTLRGADIWRIDFEENIGEALSRPLAQAYDLFQMVASLQSLRCLPTAIMPHLGEVMLTAYFEGNPDPIVRARLVRVGKLLSGIAWGLRPLLGRFAARDIQGFFRVVETLRRLRES